MILPAKNVRKFTSTLAVQNTMAYTLLSEI